MELKEKNMSVLKLKHTYVESFEFKRKPNINVDNSKPRISFTKKIKESNENGFLVSLSVSIIDTDNYVLNITLVGIFEIGGTVPDEDLLLQRNAVAILFPYLRSQITLLTSQPSFTPIVLPVLNINAIFDAEKKEQ